MEVDQKTRGSRKIIQKKFEDLNKLRVRTYDDKSIIVILENGARKVIDKGVEKEALMRGVEDELWQDIHDNVKEERGERVPRRRSCLH